MSDEQKLTEEDREKIQRLLESGTLENVTLALSLIEETAGQEDIADIFTMNVIVELICLNSPESLEVMIMAGQFIRRCPETWKRFSEAVVDPTLLTSQKHQFFRELSDRILDETWPVRSDYLDYYDTGAMLCTNYRHFTLISDAAAARIAPDEDCGLELDGLTELSDAAAESLAKNDCGLSLNGLTELSDASAEYLSRHKGELNLKRLLNLSDAAAESLSKKEPKLASTSLNFDNLTSSAAQILRDAGHGGIGRYGSTGWIGEVMLVDEGVPSDGGLSVVTEVYCVWEDTSLGVICINCNHEQERTTFRRCGIYY